MPTTNIVDKNGVTVDASTVTKPSDRHFRGAWVVDSDKKVISEDMTEAKKIFQEKVREVRKPLLEEEDVIYMKALEADDASAKSASVAKKKALRDAPASSAITNASTISELKSAWDVSVLGENPYSQEIELSSQINVDTIVDKAGSGGTNVKIANTSVTVSEGGSATTTTVQGLCKAWFVFDQANSNTIDDSFNIGSITDRGTGAIYGNFTNDMDSLHYTNPTIVSSTSSGSLGATFTNRSNIASADTTARNSVNTFVTNTLGMIDVQNVQTVVNGDLA